MTVTLEEQDGKTKNWRYTITMNGESSTKAPPEYFLHRETVDWKTCNLCQWERKTTPNLQREIITARNVINMTFPCNRKKATTEGQRRYNLGP